MRRSDAIDGLVETAFDLGEETLGHLGIRGDALERPLLALSQFAQSDPQRALLV